MRLIDAEPLKNRVTELRKVFRGEAREALDLVAAAIIKAPTAEIVSGELCAIHFKERTGANATST